MEGLESTKKRDLDSTNTTQVPKPKRWKRVQLVDYDVPEIVDSLEICQKAISILKEQKMIAVDCEWCGNKREAELCVIQVCYQIGDINKVFIFDILASNSSQFFDIGLKDILESKTIIKIFHDCRWDSDVLWHASNIKLENVLDTQILFATYKRQETSKTPLPISLNKLLEFFAFGKVNALKAEAHKDMENSPEYWKTRPMTENMIQYAREDVLNLITVFRQLKASLDPRNFHLVESRSKIYLGHYRDQEIIEETEYIPGVTLPKYGIKEWDEETEEQIRNRKARARRYR